MLLILPGGIGPKLIIKALEDALLVAFIVGGKFLIGLDEGVQFVTRYLFDSRLF
jgi:hypothetical protein